MPSIFHGTPSTAAGHSSLLSCEAVFYLLRHLRERAAAAGRGYEEALQPFPFLMPYLEELRAYLPASLTWSDAGCWLREQIAQWENDRTFAPPLRLAARDLGLPHGSLLAFSLCGLPEEDASFAALFAALPQSSSLRRPTLGQLRDILQTTGDPQLADAWALTRPLLDTGLLELVNPESPRAEWVLRVPSAVWGTIRGEKLRAGCGFVPHEPGEFQPLDAQLLPDDVAARLRRLVALLAADPAARRSVILRGLSFADQLELAGTVARALGRGLICLEAGNAPAESNVRLLGILATLSASLPLISAELAPGETLKLAHASGYSGPIMLLLGPDGGLAGEAAEDAIAIPLEPGDAQLRRRQWEIALDGTPCHDLDVIAESWLLPPAHVRQCAQRARRYAALEKREAVNANDVRQAASHLGRQSLDTLATRLDASGGWTDLVLPAASEIELRQLELRCRYRDPLARSLAAQLPGGLNRGVRVLFEGPSGTGKTLAARVLASVLGKDIYRVDLAAAVNKYIGETEKNLSRIFQRSEELDVVLLLDEGDSLMTRRTDVRSSNDRYANLETNYLLQRLDTYNGIVIVTTNAARNIDQAFRRRMDAIVAFHMPDAGLRLRLWQLHFRDTGCGASLLADAAGRFELTGGQIRNAAIQASLSAMVRRNGPVNEADLAAAIESEYRKCGSSFPGAPAPPPDTVAPQLADFLSSVW